MVDNSKPDEVSRSTATSTPRRVAIYVGIGLAALGAAYGVGRLQTQAAVNEAEQQTLARAAAQAEQSKVLELEQAKVRELEGRRQLALALLALDERNFGTAQSHLKQASALLGETKGDAAMAELTAAIAAYTLVATDDTGAQRKQLLDWTRKFDALRPPPAK
jgi:hypothetical protein